jgi:hypothetical protein
VDPIANFPSGKFGRGIKKVMASFNHGNPSWDPEDTPGI